MAVVAQTRGVTTDPAEATAAESSARLYERYRADVFRFCLSRLDTREEAEDAVQTTFFHALRALRRGIVPRNEPSWLYAIALNVCRNRRHARSRRQAVEILRDPRALEAVPASVSERSEELAGLEDALAGMTKSQRQAILLREWKGLSYHEIAVELGLSRGAVETLLFRARRSLASLLASPADPDQRRRLGGFGFGALAAAMKSLAGGGSAAKFAAAVAVATTVMGAASVPRDSNPPTSRGSGSPPVVVAPRSQHAAVLAAHSAPRAPEAVAGARLLPHDPPPALAGGGSVSQPIGPGDVPAAGTGGGGAIEPTPPSNATQDAPHDGTPDEASIARPQPAGVDPPEQPAPPPDEPPSVLPEIELPPLDVEAAAPRCRAAPAADRRRTASGGCRIAAAARDRAAAGRGATAPPCAAAAGAPTERRRARGADPARDRSGALSSASTPQEPSDVLASAARTASRCASTSSRPVGGPSRA